jgi:hypothetical protein
VFNTPSRDRYKTYQLLDGANINSFRFSDEKRLTPTSQPVKAGTHAYFGGVAGFGVVGVVVRGRAAAGADGGGAATPEAVL